MTLYYAGLNNYSYEPNAVNWDLPKPASLRTILNGNVNRRATGYDGQAHDVRCVMSRRCPCTFRL